MVLHEIYCNKCRAGTTAHGYQVPFERMRHLKEEHPEEYAEIRRLMAEIRVFKRDVKEIQDTFFKKPKED